MIVGLLFVLFTKCNQYINNNNLVTCCKNTHQSLSTFNTLQCCIGR